MDKRKWALLWGGALAVWFLLVPAAATIPSQDVVGVFSAALTPLADERKGSSECELGDLTADAVRSALGSDVAVLSSGDLAEDLPVGIVTRGDVRRVFSEDRRLASAQVTPVQLYRLLEAALSHLVTDYEQERIDWAASDFDGFPQISGFSLVIDGSARAGERIYSLTLDDGTLLDRNDEETVLTLAATAYLLDGGYGFPLDLSWAETEETLTSALEDYLMGQEITSIQVGRISTIGTNESALIHLIPTEYLLVILALIAAACLFFQAKWGAAKRKFLPIQAGDTGRRD